MWTWDAPPADAAPGQRICLTRPISPVRSFRNEPSSAQDLRYFAQNIYWRVWSKGDAGEPAISGDPSFWSGLRGKLEQHLLARLDPAPDPQSLKDRAKALIPALLFGDRRFISKDTSDKFSRGAIGHSLALSGQHLAIAGLAGFLCVIVAARFWPRIYLWRPKIALCALCACPFALFYLWLGDAPPSLIRAACMALIFCLIFIFSKNFSARDVIVLAFCALFLANPFGILEPGLQFSFLCVLVLACFLPALFRIKIFRIEKRKFAARIAQILVISLLIQAALLPLALSTFGNSGLWFPLNAFWLPLLGFVTLPFSFAALPFAAPCFPGWISSLLLEGAVLPVIWLLRLLDWLDDHGLLIEPVFLRPHWSALFAFALIFACLSCVCALYAEKEFSRKSSLPVMPKDLAGASGRFTGRCRLAKKLLALGLLFLLIGPFARLARHFENEPFLEVLDVGQGQAILLNMGAGARVLVDGGGSASRRFDPGKSVLTPLLTDGRAPYLSAVVNSHPDVDHLGGLMHILEKFKWEALFHNGREAKGLLHDEWGEIRNGGNSYRLRAGDAISFGPGELRLEVVFAPDEGVDLSPNNASLVLRLCDGERGLAVIPGDAEIQTLNKIAACGRDVSADILIAPHHGSNSSFSPRFLEAVKPRMIIASCGFRNRYYYPGKKLRDWARKKEVPLLKTGDDGAIEARLLKNGETQTRKIFRD